MRIKSVFVMIEMQCPKCGVMMERGGKASVDLNGALHSHEPHNQANQNCNKCVKESNKAIRRKNLRPKLRLVKGARDAK